VFEVRAALVYRNAEDVKYECRHLFVALTGLLAVVGVVALACGFASPWVRLYAALVLLMLPRSRAAFRSRGRLAAGLIPALSRPA
jgi:uncharacterized membrane protein YphA (DoxX/SURF4 family)